MSAILERAGAKGDIRAHGGIVLVSCYELGHQPLNLASPAGHLRSAGFDPALVDTAISSLDDADLANARLIAISVPMHTAMRLGIRVARHIRALNPSAHICFYGLYATLNAGYLLREAGDSVVGGEYEETLVALATALTEGADLSTVPGLGRAGHHAPPVLRKLPFTAPVRDALPSLRSYAGLERSGTIVRAGYVEATRGCHHTCTHCPITPVYGGRFFAVPREVVLADARAQVEAGARHITFGDPDFFNGPGHGMRIARQLREEYPRLSFDATIKVEHLLQHQELLPELAEIGFVFVVSAVESLSARVLERLNKGHSRADVESALALLDAAGIAMRPSLLPFTPWTQLEDYLELLTFFAERDLLEHVDPVHFSIRLLVPPGSALLADPANESWLGALDEEALTYRWRSPDPRLDELQRAVSAIVERAAATNETARDTFAKVWAATHDVAGLPTAPVPVPRERRSTPPRLTESWFC